MQGSGVCALTCSCREKGCGCDFVLYLDGLQQDVAEFDLKDLMMAVLSGSVFQSV